MIKTETLTANVEKLVEVKDTYVMIENRGVATVYASKNSNVSAGGDGVLAIDVGNAKVLRNVDGRIFVKSSENGVVEIQTANDLRFFKSRNSKGGGGGEPVDAYTKGQTDALLTAKEDVKNKATSLSASSTDTQYPSAKAVYTELNNRLIDFYCGVKGSKGWFKIAQAPLNNGSNTINTTLVFTPLYEGVEAGSSSNSNIIVNVSARFNSAEDIRLKNEITSIPYDTAGTIFEGECIAISYKDGYVSVYLKTQYNSQFYIGSAINNTTSFYMLNNYWEFYKTNEIVELPSDTDVVYATNVTKAKYDDKNNVIDTTYAKNSDIDDMQTAQIGENLIYKYSLSDGYTHNGITFNIKDDALISVSGTHEGDNISKGKVNRLYLLNLEHRKYVLSGCPSDGSDDAYYLSFAHGNTNTVSGKDYGDGVVIDNTDGKYDEQGIMISVDIVSGTYENLVFKPMLELGEVVHDYQPYKLSRQSLRDDIDALVALL